MRFIDEVTIELQAGSGGNGCMSFRREKYVPKGGPDGGDGGKGGDISLRASERKQTLLDFRYRRLYRAARGRHGRGKNKTGRSGEDLVLEVPVGTLVKDPESGEIFADLARAGQRWLAARGGAGGRGNARFVTSTRRAPRYAEEGRPGEERKLALELKLLADVGLVGFPNAGKSTLIATISAARPKVADYPFTTLVPNLGVVQYGDAPPFVVADIPGLIEGAHEGAGLGIRFLRHIERTRILLHLVDIGQIPRDDPLRPYHGIEHELRSYGSGMEGKLRVVALAKADLEPDSGRLQDLKGAYEATGHPVAVVSAVQRRGIDELLRILVGLLFGESHDEEGEEE